ncbi:MAG: EAL domain-containing protein [Mariprofundaceae bacterium]
MQVRSMDSGRYNDVTSMVQQLSHHDTLLNQGVLSALSGHLNHYDSLAQERGFTLKLLNQLNAQGSIISQSTSFDASNLIQKKLHLIESFKAQNAILHNSLQYFPTAVSKLNNPTNTHKTSLAMNDLLQKILLYNIRPTMHAKARVLMIIQTLKPQANASITPLLRHAEIIIEQRQSIDPVIQSILAIPSQKAIESIHDRLTAQHNQQMKEANTYRAIMYVIAVLLLLYILLLLSRLRSSMQNLKHSISELEFQKFAIDQHAIVAMTDSKGIITYANDKFCNVSQYAREEIIGQTHQMVNSGHHSKDFFEKMWATISLGKVWQGEIKNRRKNGSLYWVDTTIVPLVDSNNVPERYISIRADITARKISEQMQKGAQKELLLAASVFSDSPMGIMITDAQSNILRTNTAFSIITGYSAEESVGKRPNLLKSDLHDIDFYQNIWASLLQTGQWEGEIWNRRKNGEIFPEWSTITAIYNHDNHDNQISHFINSFTDISEKKISEKHVYHLAHYDALTDLPNRSLFLERLEQSIRQSKRSEKKLAVMFLDLDNFKTINDTMGHAAGDSLLVEVGKHLKACIRDVDLIARIGGDEFTIALTDIESTQDIALVADKILEATQHPISLNGKPVMVSASLGISTYPDDASNAAELIKGADIAMYRAKDDGKNNYQFFTQAMNESIIARHKIENDLREAIKHQQFILHYQPQVNLECGSITAVEALIRWQHPKKGMISPFHFIPVAEETGMIVEIGKWVLSEACKQQQVWHKQGFNIRIAVNVSAQQFQDPNFYHYVESTLQANQVHCENLELEVTESSLMHDPEAAVQLLNRLSQLGLSLALDDFGTGYSSLSHLKHLPIDTLKIDQSFVRDLPHDKRDVGIANTIIAMAHNLGLNVLAEGVETTEQLDFLKESGCDDVQGYLFSKPVPGNQIPALLTKDRDG